MSKLDFVLLAVDGLMSLLLLMLLTGILVLAMYQMAAYGALSPKVMQWMAIASVFYLVDRMQIITRRIGELDRDKG